MHQPPAQRVPSSCPACSVLCVLMLLWGGGCVPRDRVRRRLNARVLLLAFGRLPPRAIPAVLLQQDWALGLIGLKFAHHLAAGMPDGRLHLFGRPFQETFHRLLWTPLQVCRPYLGS